MNRYPTQAHANWFALCDLAQVAPDNRYAAEDLVRRLRKWGHARWSIPEVQRVIDAYDAALNSPTPPPPL